jgi:hypothetical protein
LSSNTYDRKVGKTVTGVINPEATVTVRTRTCSTVVSDVVRSERNGASLNH